MNNGSRTPAPVFGQLLSAAAEQLLLGKLARVFGEMLLRSVPPNVRFSLMLSLPGVKAHVANIPRGAASKLMLEQVSDWALEARTAKAGPPSVHALREGLPLCERVVGVPSDWPVGHSWTAETDIEHVTCEDCRRAAAESLTAFPCDTAKTH